MAGLPWIQLAADWKTHKKAIRLRVFLQDDWAWAYVVSLWCWTAQHQGDGLFEGPGTIEVIADAAGYKGEPKTLVDALVRAGLLDETSNGYEVHDWEDYAGAHISKREKERSRLRTYRERTRTKRVRNAYGPRTNAYESGERERERETEKETHTPPRAREAGAADRAAIDADHPRHEHPLLDALVRALRSPTCKPLYPANGARASVEAAIASVGLEIAIARVRAAWTPGRPWLTHYLEDIAPPAQREAAPRGKPHDPRAAAAPSPPESFDRRDSFDGAPT